MWPRVGIRDRKPGWPTKPVSLKICMVGCGSFARQCHGPAQRGYRASHPNAELAACCDVDPGRSREYSEAFGFARCYSDTRAMLSDESPDAVVMAVPPAAACAEACPVLERGIPLLLEKPPGMTAGELGRLIAAAGEGGGKAPLLLEKPRGMTAGELGRLIAAAGKGGGKAQVGFNRRYMPVMRSARGSLDGAFPPGSVGRIDYEMVRLDRWDPDFSTP